ncbi:hypothetical protein [Streptomyces sp. DHE17-7]|uniref:hypothetical protein n=1 Tax=Streptomyces sp. DHE17-7 TaxID=2759949 RepID=UPI0022EADC26|nr:hypothetical protein [Streptomyces sp. DHE17-7]MBJ6623610.1 hypothetical protein [Streptomyces sp. DHE17-7]
MPFDPTVNAEYLHKRFTERVWNSELSALLHMIPEAAADEMVDRLVAGLLTEVGAE